MSQLKGSKLIRLLLLNRQFQMHKAETRVAFLDAKFKACSWGAVEDSPLISVPQNAPSIRTKRFITKSICYHAAVMANEIEDIHF